MKESQGAGETVRRKDISDSQVIEACGDRERLILEGPPFVIGVLMAETGACEKVCYAAMERAYNRDLIEYVVSLRTAWPTQKGLDLLGVSQ